MADIERMLKRIDAKLTHLIAKQSKEHWVKVSFITDLTGWDSEQLRRARDQELIIWKRTEDGYWYLLESIPEQFLIHKKVQNVNSPNNR